MFNNSMNYPKTTHYKGPKYKPPRQKNVKEEIEELIKQTV